MNHGIPALVVRMNEVLNDSAFQEGGRHAVKIASITPPLERFNEVLADQVEWTNSNGTRPRPLLLADDWEIAVFDEKTEQNRHRHHIGVEIYRVDKGIMAIELEGEINFLGRGDTCIVLPGTSHMVRPDEIGSTDFTCWLACIHCGGPADKLPA